MAKPIVGASCGFLVSCACLMVCAQIICSENSDICESVKSNKSRSAVCYCCACICRGEKRMCDLEEEVWEGGEWVEDCEYWWDNMW